MGIFRPRTKRKSSLNLLPFRVLEPDGTPILESRGRARNISGAGLLLETHTLLEPGRDLQITIALQGETAEIKGQVVHIERAGGEGFWAGIEFTSPQGKGRHVLEKYLEAFSNAN